VRGAVLGQGSWQDVVDGTSLIKKSRVGKVVVGEMEAGVRVEQQPQRVALVQVAVHAYCHRLACKVHTPAHTTTVESLVCCNNLYTTSVRPKDPIQVAWVKKGMWDERTSGFDGLIRIIDRKTAENMVLLCTQVARRFPRKDLSSW
jgi:hypothetical protein